MSEQKEQGLVKRMRSLATQCCMQRGVMWDALREGSAALEAQAAENAELRASAMDAEEILTTAYLMGAHSAKQDGGEWRTKLAECIGKLMVAEARALAAETALATAREALRANFCPRPCNHRPADFEVGPCVDAGECGCMNVRALKTKEPSHG